MPTPTQDLAITTRLAPLRTVFLTVAAQAIVLWAALGDRRWMPALREATGGWVDPNLPAGALVFLLSVVPFVFLRARLRPRDIGLEPGKLARGVVVVAALWAALQLGLALLALLDDGVLRPAPHWLRPSAPAAPLGFLAAMLLVMTAVEEATYRGFVLPQLWLHLPGGPRVRTWGAVVGSALLFALVHVPNRMILYGLEGAGMAASLAALVVYGIFMAVVYLRTANLWVAGGVHALMNAPTPLVAAPVPPLLVLVPLVLVLVVLWPKLPGAARRPLLAGTGVRLGSAGEG